MSIRVAAGMGLAMAVLLGCSSLPDSAGPAVAAPASAAELETRRLHEWLDRRYEEELQFSPMHLTSLGRRQLYDQVDDVSEAALERRLQWRRRSVEQMLARFDYAALSPAGQMSYDAWKFRYQQALAAAEFHRHDYIFEQAGGAHTRPPTFLINFHKVDRADDMRAYIRRISGFARWLRQLHERARLAAWQGIRPPRFAYDSVIEQASRVITGAPFGPGEDAAIWSDAQRKADALRDSGQIDAEQASRFKETARLALLNDFAPAYRDLIAWLELDRNNLPAQAHGAGELPRGDAYYAQRLAQNTTTSLNADEIHAIGLAEVARIRQDMLQIMRQVEFDGSLQDFFAFLRNDPRFYYANTPAGRQAYLDDSAAYLAAIERKLPDYFGIQPRAELVVKRVEPYRERPGGAQHYYSGTPDGSRPGIYYAHLADMAAYSKSDMETTAYHEGSPGHHMQISIAQERDGLPLFRRQARFTVYTEGWALYAEKLAGEMGAYGDPYNHMGHLTAEMWRAIRLVVDTGLHAKGWSQEQAVEYFLANSAVPEAAVRSEVRRYLVWPGQATAYKIGMLKIQELRRKAREMLGPVFDIRGFHDAVLGGGALPLPLLERRVMHWIQAQL